MPVSGQKKYEMQPVKGGHRGTVGHHHHMAVHVATFTQFAGEGMWGWLNRTIGWRPNPGPDDQYEPVDVPGGFVCDLASVPQLFWSWLPPNGPYRHAAIIHDWLYWDQGRPREEADDILWVDMTDLDVGYVKRLAIYEAVRWLGGGAWDRNTGLKAQGERRILARFPDDPTVTWDAWKQQPGVFAES